MDDPFVTFDGLMDILHDDWLLIPIFDDPNVTFDDENGFHARVLLTLDDDICSLYMDLTSIFEGYCSLMWNVMILMFDIS